MYLENSYMEIFNRYALLQKDCIINNSNKIASKFYEIIICSPWIFISHQFKDR